MNFYFPGNGFEIKYSLIYRITKMIIPIINLVIIKKIYYNPYKESVI
jgi:hypothetical protein